MNKFIKFSYLIVIIFIAGAGTAKAVGFLNYDAAKDAFTVDGRLVFNNPDNINIKLKELASSANQTFFINSDKMLQLRIGQNSANTSYAFTVHKNDGKPVARISNNGSFSFGSDVDTATGVKFKVDAASGAVNISGSTRVLGGFAADGSANPFSGWISSIRFNGGNGMISFPAQSLGFGITSNGFYWANLPSSAFSNISSASKGAATYPMTVDLSGNLVVSDRIISPQLCLSGVCITEWSGAVNLQGYITKTDATSKVSTDIKFGFGGVYSTGRGNTNCIIPNPYGSSSNNGGCSCPSGYTASRNITQTSGTADIYFCSKQ